MVATSVPLNCEIVVLRTVVWLVMSQEDSQLVKLESGSTHAANLTDH